MQPSEHFVELSVKILSQLSLLRLRYPSINFDHEANLKVLIHLELLDWRVEQIF